MNIHLGRRAILVLALVALVVLVLWQANQLRLDRRGDSLREGAVAAAEAQVLDLTTLDSVSVDVNLRRMAKRTSGDFRDQLQGITKTFSDLVAKNQIKASGLVVSRAVSSFSDSDATVLIASSAAISEKGGKPVTRTYRMRVKLERDSGSWKINGMEFVQ